MSNGTVVWTGLEELRADLRQYLAYRCGDPGEVEDVIQETLMRAARYRGRLARAELLLAWARSIARNVLADRARRERHLGRVAATEAVLESQPSREEPEDECAGEVRCGTWVLDRDVALDLLAGELRQMRADDRELLTSYYGGESSCREVAAATNLPPALVKVRLFRARRRLLAALRRRLALSAGLKRATA